VENRSLAKSINTIYERRNLNQALAGVWSYFDRIGFLNAGYWKGVDDSMEHAQINLMETLASFFSNTAGNILDVACGKGASSKFLTKYFDPARITGINIMEQQLEICKVIAPECNFELMDATALRFENASFDNMLCIEAAFHFLTRYRFLEEAYRVLKPSGRLAMLDVLCDPEPLKDILDSETLSCFPKENYVPNLDVYRESLLKVGFSYVRVEDCTDLTANAACRYVTRMAEREFGRTQDRNALEGSRLLALHYKASSWCLVYAIK
jgi:MPBQ/MSBQ methyltransferase